MSKVRMSRASFRAACILHAGPFHIRIGVVSSTWLLLQSCEHSASPKWDVRLLYIVHFVYSDCHKQIGVVREVSRV